MAVVIGCVIANKVRYQHSVIGFTMPHVKRPGAWPSLEMETLEYDGTGGCKVETRIGVISLVKAWCLFGGFEHPKEMNRQSDERKERANERGDSRTTRTESDTREYT